MLDAGIPELLFERFDGRLEYHTPWHTDRVYSHLFRGLIDVDEANALLAERGHDDLRLLDNGAIGRPMEGLESPTSTTSSRGRRARRARSRSTCGRAASSPSSASRVGDSLEDLDVAEVVGRFFVPANGPERDPRLREAISRLDNVTVTEGRWATGSTRPSSRRWPS